MELYLRRFALNTACSFAVLAVLAFTPLRVIPLIMSLPADGLGGLLSVLYLLGAPFGGFLFVLLFSSKSERVQDMSALAGVWVGTILGSVAGLKVAETI